MPLTPSLAGPTLRVLLVAHNLGDQARAGTEVYCLKLGLALAEAGFQVAFLAPQGPPVEGPKAPVPWRQGRLAGLPFFQFARTNQDFGTCLAHPGFEAAFREILDLHPVDLVHFHHTFLTSISLPRVALECGLPAVLTLHDAWHLCPRLHCQAPGGPCTGPESAQKCVECLSPWLNPDLPEAGPALKKFLVWRRAYVQDLLPRLRLLAPSRFLRRLHYRHGFAPGHIIHLPLGLDELVPVPDAALDSPPRFIFLGNLVPVKRADLAVAAFLPLAGQASLELWGQAPLDQAQSLLQTLAPHPHIHFRGPYRREDLPRILAGATAVVVPSDFENFPLVVREALMLKVPVIAAQAGGIPEIVRHGENGLLFPAGDAEALRRRVVRILKRPELAKQLRQGIAPVKTISQEAKELLDLYYSWAAFRPRRPSSSPSPRAMTEPAADLDPQDPPSVPGLASIIIPTYDNLALTRDCLTSIREHTPPGIYEVIVVDNGSTDGTPDFLRQQEAEGLPRALLNDRNLGFARASNQGARAARGEFLVFLNNDTVVTPGWLEELLRCVRDDARVAAVGAKLLYPDDTVQHAGVAISAAKRLVHIYKGFHRDHPAVNKERTFQVLTAACLLVRKAEFFEVGAFDEGFMNGFEDVDLCLKLGRQGRRLLYNPRAVVYHLESKTAGRFDREAENARRLAARWLRDLVPDEDHYYREDGMLLNSASL